MSVSLLRCACPCPGNPARRRWLWRGVAALPALGLAGAAAAERLALLDPSQMGSRTPGRATPVPSATGGAAAGHSVAEGRVWFHNTAGALERLFSLVRAQGAELLAARKQANDLAERLAAALRERDGKIDEVRNGLFCSGCNQTRSEILAKGERFPHPGQSIIRATPEQVVAKERELNVAIDRLRQQLQAARDREREKSTLIDEACDQIQAGCGLLSTATYAWRSAIVAREHRAADRLIRERDAAFAAAAQASDLGERASALSAVEAARAELDSWAAIVARLNEGFATEWNAVQAAMSEMHGLVKSRIDLLLLEGQRVESTLGVTEIQTKFARGYYHLLKGAGAEVSPGRFGGEGTEGLRFRLGDASPAQRGQVLASVRRFVEVFRAGPLTLSLRFARLPDFDSDPFRHERRRLEIRSRELTPS
jgi:predicted Fe-S protein YdhL (DUF1289 family)